MAKLIATTYDGLNRAIGGKPERKIGHNTTARRESGDIVVRLHYTDIVRLHADGSMTVNSGGFHTVTTKERINQFMPRDLGITQHKFKWYFIQFSGGSHVRLPYEDHTRIDADGQIIGVEA